MTQEKINEILASHKEWIVNDPNGVQADLSGIDLRGTDLRGANLDYASFRLWCGSFDVKVDKRIAAQIAYHFCRLDCDDPEYIKMRNALADFANEFHRIDECGKIKKRRLGRQSIRRINKNINYIIQRKDKKCKRKNLT